MPFLHVYWCNRGEFNVKDHLVAVLEMMALFDH